MAARDWAVPPKAAPRSGTGLSDRLRDFTHLPRDLAMARLGYDLKRPVFALPMYRYSLGGPVATTVRVSPPDPWPGDAILGAAIIQGNFRFLGRSIANPAPLWSPRGLGADWLAELHAFSWLRDLRAAGGDIARRRARDLVGTWIADNGAWNALAWEPRATGRRLANWLACYDFFAASAAVDFRHRVLGSIAAQARHLQRVLPAGLAGAEAIAAIKGLIFAGACLPNGNGWRDRGLVLLRRELVRQILADGGQIERNPSAHLAILRDLVDIRAVLHKGEPREDAGRGNPGQGERADPPVELNSAIEAMARTLRMFLHGDGGLALFNGAAEGESWQIEMILQRAGGRGRPRTEATESGFQRMQAGRMVVLMDAGAPPPPGLDGQAHAGTLGLEVSIGRERLIVNCGTRPGDAAWHWAQRATAAHSTLVVDETNSSELLSQGLGHRANILSCHREESDGNIWLEASHDGYRGSFGVIHQRRIYLAANGVDLRGEDRLETRTSANGPDRAPGEFALRFHFHPDARANLAHSGDAILLRLAKGGGWRLRAAGAKARLEPSVYLGGGEIRRCLQAVFTASLPPDGAEVQWALKRIDRKSG
jgi:uncharacterized heparinase superfamily protein